MRVSTTAAYQEKLISGYDYQYRTGTNNLRIFNQDVYNIPKVQLGLKTMKQPFVTFASYNESKIRHFHGLLERWLEIRCPDGVSATRTLRSLEDLRA